MTKLGDSNLEDTDFSWLFSTLFSHDTDGSTPLVDSQLLSNAHTDGDQANIERPPLVGASTNPPANQGIPDEDMPALESDSDWETDLDGGSDIGDSREVTGMYFYAFVVVLCLLYILGSMPRWSPWPTHMMFLADAMFTSPHLNFSHPQMRAVLHFANACGASDVPSLEALNKTQERLKSVIGDPAT
ncbi:hypothetical protein OPQ81_002408 [Rhizoctonia solani]|nr:hypothetical protein OPQ81_002408 [Rhizoctonia solani]